jgi:hypothetical protein
MKGEDAMVENRNAEQGATEREKELQAEIAEFNKERDRIRHMIGQIGGARYSKRDNAINFAFLALIVAMFMIEVATQWLPAYFSIEVSLLLVSIKIVWMIHGQQKYNHFVFWILNSIEFRINEDSRRLREIEKRMGRD